MLLLLLTLLLLLLLLLFLLLLFLLLLLLLFFVVVVVVAVVSGVCVGGGGWDDGGCVVVVAAVDVDVLVVVGSGVCVGSGGDGGGVFVVVVVAAAVVELIHQISWRYGYPTYVNLTYLLLYFFLSVFMPNTSDLIFILEIRNKNMYTVTVLRFSEYVSDVRQNYKDKSNSDLIIQMSAFQKKSLVYMAYVSSEQLFLFQIIQRCITASFHYICWLVVVV